MSSAPDSDAAAEALATSPVAVAGVCAQGLVGWANAACQALLPDLRAGLPLAGRCGLEPADEQRLSTALAAPDAAASVVENLRTGSGALQARLQPARGGGRLVWLLPVERLQRAESDAERLADLLRMACNMGRLGVWEHDLVTGQGFCGEHAFRSDGLEGSKAGKDATGAILDSDQPAVEAAMRHSLQPPAGFEQRRHWRIRYRVRGGDGVVRALHRQWYVQHAPDGRPLRRIGLVMDDSDADALMRTRDESVSQLALAADLTGLAVWRQDLATGRVALSPEAFALFDLVPVPDDVPIEKLRALLHPADRGRVARSVQATLDGGPPADDEVRLRRRDGTWATLVVRRAVQRDPAGEPRAIVGVALDVTERRAKDRRADELGRRFELAIDAAGIGYWTFDARTRATRWSKALYLTHALPQDTRPPGLQRWLADFVHPDDRTPVGRRIDDWLRSERQSGGRLGFDVRIVRPGGELRELMIQVMVEDQSLDDGNLFGLVIDVTERRLAEAAGRDHERAVRESEAKSRFLSRMNHELRTPLNAVLGFAQLLRDEDVGTDPAAAKRLQRVGHIRSAGLHLLELINDAIDLSSLEGGESPLLRQPVSLATLVAETLPLVEALSVERGVQVDAAGAADGIAMADPTRLRQALLNLVSNAVKYNRRRGSVRVDAWVQGQTAVLRVADTGRGMTPEQLRHLFEPFNRLGVEHEGIEGSGIGLAIVKSLVERMGGRVHVQSEAGVGSVFELHLPSAEPAATAGVPGTRRDRKAATAAAARTVLYVEDDPVNAMILDELLSRRRDVVVHVAVNGLEGLAAARRLQPALILLDMHLPDIDGLEVLSRLRADPAIAAIPVVGLSANAMREDVDRARAFGIDGYWAKPIDHAAFLSALDSMFERDPATADTRRAAMTAPRQRRRRTRGGALPARSADPH